jgi:hypothetical protein
LKTSVIFVFRSYTVLDLGILSILNAANGRISIQVVPDNISNILKAVEINLPDVIILSQGSYAAQHSLFRNLLSSLHAIRTLTIYTESNHVCINQSQIVKIEKSTDLINLIHNRPQPRLPGEKMTMEQIQEQLKQLTILNLKANSKEENL